MIEMVQRLKQTVHLPEARDFVVRSRQRRVFNNALCEFVNHPWESLHPGNDVLFRLVYGWGNSAWSAQDEYLAAIIEEFSKTDGPVLECGSGLSTIILGVLASITGRRVWTLEHEAEWAAKVTDVLDDLNITSVNVHVSNLISYGDYSWYNPPLNEMPNNFTLVICDGPPGSIQGGRYGMLPIMHEYLSDDLSILMDDTVRNEERDIARRWAESLGGDIENCGKDNFHAIIRTSESERDGNGTTENRNATVTVGIPAYNSEKNIGQSIDSILSQTYRDLNLCISDNSSSDKTPDECLQRIKSDSRVRYYRQKRNIGVFQNFNELFLLNKSKYFKWQSSSDWCQSELIEKSVAFLDANPDVVLVYTNVYLVDGAGNCEKYTDDFGLEMDDPADRFMYLIRNIQLCNMDNGVIRSSALATTKLNQSFSGSDVVLLAELALRGKIVLLQETLWYRRMTSDSASKMHSAEQRKEFFRGAPLAFDKYVTWKIMWALFLAVLRSGIKVRSQVKCLKQLCRMVYWSRASLYREVFT